MMDVDRNWNLLVDIEFVAAYVWVVLQFCVVR